MKDKALLEAAEFIKRAQPTKVFFDFLLTEREEARTRLETAKGDQVYVEQGKAQQLTNLIKLIEEASNILEQQ